MPMVFIVIGLNNNNINIPGITMTVER